MKIGKISSPMLLLFSVVGGIVITLLTGMMNSTPGQLVGATWYGYPTSWIIRMVVAPQYNPWSFQAANFVIDVVVWFVVVAVVLLAAKYAAKPKAGSKAKR